MPRPSARSESLPPVVPADARVAELARAMEAADAAEKAAPDARAAAIADRARLEARDALEKRLFELRRERGREWHRMPGGECWGLGKTSKCGFVLTRRGTDASHKRERAGLMSSATLPAVSNGAGATTLSARIDHNAVLRAVGLNLTDPNAQAVLLTCERYGLDPILKHMMLIQGRPYVTRDGLLHVAHRSGQFDGMEVLEQGETQTHHTAKVSVYRKDMGRPFTYIGRYPKNGGNRAYGPEMAVKCAEVMALRRAFDVALCAREEAWDQDLAQDPGDVVEVETVGRREVNEAFPRRPKSPPRDEAPEPMPEKRATETWAGYVAKVCSHRRDYWHNELAIANVPEADRKRPENQLPDQHQLTNHMVTRAVASGAVRTEAISKDGKPDGPRDPAKAKAAMADLFRRAPNKVAAAVEAYFAEKEREARVRLGMDDLDADGFDAEFAADTAGQDVAEQESQEVAVGREPGCDDDR